MATRVKLQYGISFGKLDSSDWVDYWINLAGDAEKDYLAAMEIADPEKRNFSGSAALVQALENAADDIKDEALDNLRDAGDEYALSFHKGYDKVDTDELDELVHNRDPHALEFFGLTDADDEELEDWYADELDWDDLPEYEVFYQGYEAGNPFNEGYILSVHYADDPECSC